MSDATRVRCLGDELSEYAAARLPLERQWAWDRHLVTCRVCAHAVEEERRLRRARAGAPSMPGDLRSSLLALGRALAAETPQPVPVPARHEALTLLAPSAPPCHRSPLRATVLAAAAAGVSAAAAWSLTVVPVSTTARPALATTSTPAVQSTTARTPASGSVSAVTAVGLSQTVVLTRATQRAESTP